MSHVKATKRRLVMEMYDYHCAYCGCELDDYNSTLDHVVPKIKGGTNHHQNLMPSCGRCNSIKTDMLIYEYRAYLLNRLNSIFPTGLTEIEFYFEKCENKNNGNWLSKITKKLLISKDGYKTPRSIIQKIHNGE